MNWSLRPQYADLKASLASSLGVSEITAQTLINRGITKEKDAKRFLNPDLQHLHDPFLMADMDKGVRRIIRAIKANERVSICGDYDADGVTSTALLIRFFRTLGVEVFYHIPNRLKEGYGIHKSAIDELHGLKTDLIITVDNGINAYEEVEYARGLGIDVVVTDHHEPRDKLPDAVAVINIKRSDSKFPFRQLAGVGVVFNLIMALRQRLREEGFFKGRPEPRLRDLLDIVAVGTVADVVPLLDENRILVRFGLEELKKSTNKGLNALKLASGLEPHQIDATSIAFRIAPRINAAGRLDDPTLGVRLLITEDSEEAAQIAQRLHELNSKRQSIEEGILKEAEAYILTDEPLMNGLGTVVYKDGWHRGVIGIVAARLAEANRKPTVVISIEGDAAHGSARSVGDYNIIEALTRCSRLLTNFGGHTHAAGVRLEAANVAGFKEEFNKIVSATLKNIDREDSVLIDAELSSEDVTEDLIEELEMMEPFGEGNPEPVFCMRDMKVAGARIVGEKHLKLRMTDNMMVLNAIGFGMGHHNVAEDDILDVAFVPQKDTWRGNGAVQLKLRDIIAK